MAPSRTRAMPAGVGIVGCGNISGIYFQAGSRFRALNIRACADLDKERARKRAAEHRGVRACSVSELLADPEIEIVLNLTTPDAHYDICAAALSAGKNAYVEKPLSVSRQDGKKLLAASSARGLRLGGAPDTFLGGGLQTCRKLLDDGAIGEPIGATAFMVCHGHESWHPDPEFYYKAGGGPMFDMGPYYLTALVSLLGPIRRITGAARISFPERVITSAPRHGQKIRVEVPTHVAGIVDFASGAIGTILTSFDVWYSQLPRIELYGSEGTLDVPDPNGFGGPVRIRRMGDADWTEAPLTHGFTDNSRGLGVADMAQAMRSGRMHRANGRLAYHVLEAMHGFHDASTTGAHYIMESTVEQPAPLPTGLQNDAVDP